ncbi:MAG: rhodanese-like domain-containing protein [Proteobacteria bacterium]|nr:rhodanese-like domain-containing protein [Pseudomonadota bacterium]
MSLKNIESTQLNGWINNKNILLIDVRNTEEVLHGIISGAVHVPISAIPEWLDNQDKEACYVFYCHSGIRSANAALLVEQIGFSDVYNLSGGVLAWHHAGFEFTKK